MALGFSAATANAILDALVRGTSYAGNASVYAQLHIGDPGSAGTANPAGETDRVQVVFGSAASGGAISNTTAVVWTNVSNSEDYTHVSLWTASVAGSFIMSGLVTANAVTSGDTFTIPVGDVDLVPALAG